MRKSTFFSFLLSLRQSNCIYLLLLAIALFFCDEISCARTLQQNTPLSQSGISVLTPGMSVENSLVDGQSHDYQFAMQPLQIVKTVIDMKGIDCKLSLLDTNGKLLVNKDLPHMRARGGSFLWEAPTAGIYHIQISANGKSNETGKYSLKVDIYAANEQQSFALQKYNQAENLYTQYFANKKIEPLNQAIEAFQEALRLWRRVGNGEMEARSLYFIARLTYELDEDNEAPQRTIAAYAQALPIFRSLELKNWQASTLLGLASAYSFTGELSSSLDCQLQAYALGEYLAPGQKSIMLNNITNVHVQLGEYSKALEFGLQTIANWRELGSRFDEMAAHTLVSETYRLMGEPIKALESANNGLAIAREFKDLGRSVYLYIVVGRIYREVGDLQRAQEFFLQALTLSRQQNALSDIGSALENLGDVAVERGDQKTALDYYNESASLYKKHGNKRGEAYIMLKLGILLAEAKDFDKALAYQNSAYDFLHTAQLRRAELGALYEIAKTYRSKGDIQKAEDLFNRALTLSHEMDARLIEGQIFRQLSGIARSRGEKQAAANFMTQALSKVEDTRARLISKDLKAIFSSKAQDFYEEYIDLLMNDNPGTVPEAAAAMALQAAESAKARSLLDILITSKAAPQQGISPELLKRQQELQQSLVAKEIAHERLASRAATRKQADAVLKERNNLSIQLQLLESQLRQNHPHYAALTQPQSLSAAEIQQQLDNNTVLLEFALGEKASWLWAVSASQLTSFKLPPRGEIEASARIFYELLTARQSKKEETEKQYQNRIAEAEVKLQAQSIALSQMLLAQISAKLQGEWKGKRLAIVASGALEYIPFAALTLDNHLQLSGNQTNSPQAINNHPSVSGYQPLIAEHEIINLPSASVLALIRRETAGRKPSEKFIAVIADPVFEATDTRVLKARQKTGNKLDAGVRSANEVQPLLPENGSQTRSVFDSDLIQSAKSFPLMNLRDGFSRLPFSREEAEAIASLTPKNSLLKETDFQANYANVSSGKLHDYRIIHFATHGLLNSERPELSGLVLSLVDENGKAQDGFLRMQEIYNLNLPAELVVLSACQTGLGKEIKGEGLVGLTRGFMYAGAQRVVASLWKVDDFATAQLMKSFYRGMLKDGLKPAAALRAAQLEMLKQKNWSSPFFWAAFTIQGEWK